MPVPRERLLEAALPEMPYGESGEAAPSLIPYQVMSRSDSVPGSLHRSLAHCFASVRRDVMTWRGGIGAGTSVPREFYARWLMDCFWRLHSFCWRNWSVR